MTITTFLAKTLRRIELYGFEIRIDRLEMMLRYLTNLEACRIIHARRFNPRTHVYDDEEPKERQLGRLGRGTWLEDDWDYSELSGWFDASTVEEFKAAKENFKWPPQLTIALELSSIPASDYESVAPHLNLETVELATWDYPLKPQPLIRDILTAVRAKKLPSLQIIKLTPPWKHRELPWEECEALGIKLEEVVRPEPTFYGMSKWHHK
ncbi:hypothetical protein C0992_010572 [Termitomyces sp. T32_za158]|nr:hypothetical protein C0992_010572 [Termitomyces sp. T32_za158]